MSLSCSARRVIQMRSSRADQTCANRKKIMTTGVAGIVPTDGRAAGINPCRPFTNVMIGSDAISAHYGVQVGAHTSAWVEGDGKGCVVRFTDQSAYAGHVLATGEWVFQLPLPLFKSCDFGPI